MNESEAGIVHSHSMWVSSMHIWDLFSQSVSCPPLWHTTRHPMSAELGHYQADIMWADLLELCTFSHIFVPFMHESKHIQLTVLIPKCNSHPAIGFMMVCIITDAHFSVIILNSTFCLYLGKWSLQPAGHGAIKSDWFSFNFFFSLTISGSGCVWLYV